MPLSQSSLPPLSAIKAEQDRRACRRLSVYLQRGWSEIDPEPYVHGWHMDAVCEHLEACARHEITRLLINVPPGTSKSSAAGVFFPSWLWGPFGWPEARIISAAHEQELAIRDNRRNRQMVESGWYQERWPLPLTSDQNEKRYFENSKRGFRQASAVKSMTGRRGDVVIWDDPLSPEKAYSQPERDTANRVFAETLPTRLVSPKSSVIIIIMQRLHQNDPSGYILARDLGYEHLMLPMEYEEARCCYTSVVPSAGGGESRLGKYDGKTQHWIFEGEPVPDYLEGHPWRDVYKQDPRTDEGELLFPDRFPREVVDRDKGVMGSFATAGQFQQRPVPREGGMFKSDWFPVVHTVPAGTVFVRGWDLAASTKNDSPYTVGVKMGKTPQGRYIIADVKRGQWSAAEVRKRMRAAAEEDGVDCRQDYPQDPGQAGKDQAQSIARDLAGYPIHYSPESGDKATRADPLAAQAEAGNVELLAGAWNTDFTDEACTFPFSTYKDQVDAASRAFSALTRGGQQDKLAAPISIRKSED